MLLHPLLGLPHVCRADYGAEGVTFKLLVSSENIKSLGCLIYTVLLELGSRRRGEAALPLRLSPGWYRQHFYPGSVRHTSQRRPCLHAVEIS